MHLKPLFHGLLATCFLVSATAGLAGCSKKDEASAVAEQGVTAENIADSGAITEKHDAGETVWSVAPEGQVKLLVKGSDGKPIDKNVTGTLMVKAAGDKEAKPTTVNLEPEPKTGLLVATVPKLEADITEIKYELKADGKPMKGALHVPVGGTAEIVANAKVAAEAKVDTSKKGPNGGVIQVVGDDTIEVVADKSSGKVRVYFLDADLKPVKVVTEKKVTVAVVTQNGPETVILEPDSGGLYFTGKLNVAVNPVKLTVGVRHKDRAHVVLVGHRPHTVVVVGAAAVPAVFVVANAGWGVTVGAPAVIIHDDDDDDHHWRGKGKGKGRVKVKGGKGINIHIH